MRNHRLFGVVIAVLLGTAFCTNRRVLLTMTINRSPDPLRWARHQLTSAECPAIQVAPLALGEEHLSACCARRAPTHSAPSTWRRPTCSPAGLDGRRRRTHIGLLRPAGTRYVKCRRLDGVPARPRTPAPARPLRRSWSIPASRHVVATARWRPSHRATVPPAAACGPSCASASPAATTPTTPATATTAPTSSPGDVARTRVPGPARPARRRPSRTRPPRRSRPAAAGASGRRAPGKLRADLSRAQGTRQPEGATERGASPRWPPGNVGAWRPWGPGSALRLLLGASARAQLRPRAPGPTSDEDGLRGGGRAGVDRRRPGLWAMAPDLVGEPALRAASLRGGHFRGRGAAPALRAPRRGVHGSSCSSTASCSTTN